LLKGIPEGFRLTNYAYPLDVSDPSFVTIAEINGYAAAGYKPEGKGNVIYLGFEYYYDEPVSTRLLVNAVLWGNQYTPSKTEAMFGKTGVKPRRATLRLAPGDIPSNETFKLKIYPNPFLATADIDIAIAQATPISIEITDQIGKLVAVVLERKTLAAGRHILELPDVKPGVYFVKCKSGATTIVRKIVKVENN
jgi:hypothetical protein